ncbi:MAG: MBL fold metallo-hydrolase [Proteobacteria bacterium]|nr:MBL fold metallo-hydrolase [Pseudomonadota bacterium]
MGTAFTLFCAGALLVMAVVANGAIKPARSFAETSRHTAPTPGISVITVFDNYAVDPALTTRWGFASVVITPSSTLLFDTGSDGKVLLSNMKKMGLAPTEIDMVVISHAHMDHLGGLEVFLKANPNVTVYIPSSFSDTIRHSIRAVGAEYRDVDGPLTVAKGLRVTGGLDGGLTEQALIVETAEGLVILTGCAHPGIVAIVERAKEILPDRPVALVMGGFHLVSASESEIDRIVHAFRRLAVERVAPSHCSGDRARQRFAREYDQYYIEGGVGNVVVFD